MILIISSEYDVSSNLVISWLSKIKANFIRFNSEQISTLNVLCLGNKSSYLKINEIDFDKVSIVWHRRGRLRLIAKELSNLGNITRYLKKEEDALIKSIEEYSRINGHYIGSYLKEVENYKINHLIYAKKAGLIIPETLLTTKKEELLDFYYLHKKIITKDIRYPINISFPDGNLSSVGTFLLSENMILDMSNDFAPALVQNYIEKQFEIRYFFHDDLRYAMAIFSQNDNKTKIDYRNYNEKVPNRCVPFKLPDDIIENLNQFIKLSDLRTGSIDLIFTKSKEFVFLEVNPMGQFDWLSKNCNYYIEKNIAENLMRYETDKTD